MRFLYVFLSLLISLNISVSSAQTTTDTKKKEGLRYVGYSPGLYTPFGAMVGALNSRGFGLYISGRANHHILKTSQYYFKGSALSDPGLFWRYTGEKKYSRWEANLGGIVPLYQHASGLGIKFFVGGGLVQPRYLYQFKKTGGRSSNNVWVEYREISKLGYNAEMGIIVQIMQSTSVQLGVSSFTKKHERMITFGIGKGLYNLDKINLQ